MVVGYAPDTLVKYYFSMEKPSLLMLLMGSIVVFVCNLLLMILLILRNTRTVEKAMSPILQGIQDLSRGSYQSLDERGELAEINAGLNRAGDYLMQKDNTRAEWIRGVSHDIRTPLSMVMGYSEALAASQSISPEDRKKAELITAQSIKIKKMVDDLNLISSLEYDMQPSKKREFKICPMLRNIVTELINNGLSEKYEISIDFKSEKAIINGDESLMERAFFNIINNAIGHNENGCHINIDEYVEKGNVYIKISDDGAGIPEEVIKNISVIPKSAHGLGLPMAYRIIDVHGGKMTLKNDHGLIILIELPCIN